MSVRKIPIQSSSIAGYFYSYKNKRAVAYESQLEKKCFLMLEFDKTVLFYEEQPLKIDLYIPDVLAERKNKSKLLIEVKYSNDVEKADEKLKKKFKAVKEFCNNKEWDFQIFTENEITYPYFDNISFLYRYVKINAKNEQEIIDFVRNNKETTIKNLIDSKFNAIEIYSLIAQGKLNINLHKEMSKQTAIKVCYE